MGSHANDSDEPLTPAGRLFLRPEMNTIIHCVVGFKHPINVGDAKSTIKNSLMVQHPRFSSLMVRDARGIEHWRKTHIDIDRHVIIVGDDVVSVNDYVAELSVSSPLSYDKPLWEIHLLVAHKCAVFRIHHALGDGISLTSLLLASCRTAADSETLPTVGVVGKRRDSPGASSRDWRAVVVRFAKMVLFSLVFCAEFVMRALCICDRKTSISGGAGVELWPRKLATARFRLEDMKAVKKAVDNATINDVLFGVVSSGLSRYLEHRWPNALQEGLRITGVAMINLREQPGLQELSDLMKRNNSGSGWGNKFGMLLLPIYYHKAGSDPLAYLKRAKAMIDKKKLSLEGHFSYRVGDLVMSWFGSKVACVLNYRIVCNTSFTISNVVGPQEEITLAGNPVTYLRANTSSLPHALTMHAVSYAGIVDMQILVAKDIIPEPEFLAKCFEDALLEMKEAATVSTKK